MIDVLLCDPNTVRVAIMNNRLCSTGLMAFAYPERTYGYSNHVEVTAEDVPVLADELQQRGFMLEQAESRWNAENPEYWADSLIFAKPGTKHWTDFHVPNTFVDSTEKCNDATA